MQGSFGRGWATLIASFLVVLGGASTASGATTIGETFNPTGLGGCANGNTALQASSPAGQYAAPAAGVITAWSFQAGVTPPPSLRLKVARPSGGAHVFTIVGDSPAHVIAPGTLNTFTDVRIPVQAGDVIGFFAPGSTGECATGSTAAYEGDIAAGDQAVAATATYTPVGTVKIDLSARLEPDADNDGFGDETQDGCPSDASTSEPCQIPETTIAGHPKSKTKKKTARFEFTSSLPGSTFECKIEEGIGFGSCSSPLKIKAGKGKHTFAVRAVSSNGVVDPTPATFSWKVKKKKKK